MDRQGLSIAALRSCSKITGEGKKLEDLTSGNDSEPWRLKTRDLQSILNSQEAEHKSSTNGEESIQIPGSASFLGLSQEGSCNSPAQLEERSQDSDIKSSVRLDLNLNIADVSDSTEHNPFRSKSQSECGSTTGQVEESEPLKKWREMKRNGFFSSLHGGIPPIPKPRGRPPKRKKEDDENKKTKLEAARRRQKNRLAKVASPSGLFSGLNPGIINHVRNRKQVYTIIEAVIKSEKTEEKDSADEKGGERWMIDPPSRRSFSFSVRNNIDETKNWEKPEDDSLELKLTTSGTIMPLENASNLSADEAGADNERVDFLSIKAATVAGHWLELLFQDTRGRLAALRRSRKRVRYAMQRELPNLLSSETLSNQENQPSLQSHDSSACIGASADHEKHWRRLFKHMDLALAEEGKHLERLLGQVREMQTKCEKGLQMVNDDASLRVTSSEKSRLKEEETLEGEYAVRAAAASLYSACNFVLTADNVACF